MIHKFIQFFCSLYKCGNNLTPVNGLAPSVDNPSFYKGHQIIRENFRMDTKILFILQEFQNSVGNGSLAHLERRPVFNQGGDIVSDFFRYRVIAADQRNFIDIFTVLHKKVDIRNMYQRVATQMGHLIIYLSDGHS